MLPEILQRIINHSTPFLPPKPWDFLAPDPNIRVLTSDPTKLVDALVVEFPADELVDTRVLTRTSENEFLLNPIIGGNEAFKVLRETKDGLPFDLESFHGRLTDGDPAAFRCREDYATRERSKKKWVLAAFSNMNYVLLNLLGFSATTACGLRGVTGDQARRFPTPPPTTGAAESSTALAKSPGELPKLVLVAMDLFALKNQMPAGSLHVATRFQLIERTLQLDTKPFVRMLLPSTANFRRIRDGVELADKGLIVQAIKNGMQQAESIAEYFKSATTAPVVNEVLRAKKQLQAGLDELTESTYGLRNLTDRLNELSRALHDKLVERALHAATVADDLIKSALWCTVVEYLEMLFEFSPIVQRTRSAIATGRGTFDHMPLEERLRFQRSLADALIKAKKALDGN